MSWKNEKITCYFLSQTTMGRRTTKSSQIIKRKVEQKTKIKLKV
jgi:hypothetical protein